MRASSSFAGSHLLDRVGFVRQIVVRYERAHGAGWLQVEVVSEVANVSSEMCIGGNDARCEDRWRGREFTLSSSTHTHTHTHEHTHMC